MRMMRASSSASWLGGPYKLIMEAKADKEQALEKVRGQGDGTP